MTNHVNVAYDGLMVRAFLSAFKRLDWYEQIGHTAMQQQYSYWGRKTLVVWVSCPRIFTFAFEIFIVQVCLINAVKVLKQHYTTHLHCTVPCLVWPKAAQVAQ